MKPEIIIMKEKDNKIIFDDKETLIKLLDQFYEAGYQDGKKNSITITNPSESNIWSRPSTSPWTNQPYYDDDSSAVTDWKQKIVYTTDVKID